MNLLTARVHGGPDALGAATHDFSTNSHAGGPCPAALRAVQQADARAYPDPEYTAVRAALADLHGVPVHRVLVVGSASEAITRLSALTVLRGGKTVFLPRPAYGDYAHAAQAWGLQAVSEASQAALVWDCAPSSPLGQWQPLDAPATSNPSAHTDSLWVRDCAYLPLCLPGGWDAGRLPETFWTLWSPNKALGLTGVRAAYLLAPAHAEATVQALLALAPSWPVGAHGVALLQAWATPEVQQWLRQSLPLLAAWKRAQVQALEQRGWQCLPSVTPFWSARPAPGTDVAALCAALRGLDIELRDTTSMGLPGHVRMRAHTPESQAALCAALDALTHTALGTGLPETA